MVYVITLSIPTLGTFDCPHPTTCQLWWDNIWTDVLKHDYHFVRGHCLVQLEWQVSQTHVMTFQEKQLFAALLFKYL